MCGMRCGAEKQILQNWITVEALSRKTMMRGEISKVLVRSEYDASLHLLYEVISHFKESNTCSSI